MQHFQLDQHGWYHCKDKGSDLGDRGESVGVDDDSEDGLLVRENARGCWPENGDADGGEAAVTVDPLDGGQEVVRHQRGADATGGGALQENGFDQRMNRRENFVQLKGSECRW